MLQCKYDTDGDGDCHMCHRKPGGCPTMVAIKSIDYILDRIAEARADGADTLALASMCSQLPPLFAYALQGVQLPANFDLSRTVDLSKFADMLPPDPDMPTADCTKCGNTYMGTGPCPTCDDPLHLM